MTYNVHLSLGSNIRPRRNVVRCVRELSSHGRVAAISPVYETKPVDMEEGAAPFHNLCLRLETSLPPEALKEELRGIESRLGRERRESATPYRSRPIDVDILLYDPAPEGFEVHPQVYGEAFVVFPLHHLLDPARIPGGTDRVRDWLDSVDRSLIVGIVDYDWPDPWDRRVVDRRSA